MTARADPGRAWLVLGAAFAAGFVVFGTLYSFGAFFRPMIAEFGGSGVSTSAFFALAGLVFYASGALTGRLSDRLGPRIVVGAGAVIMGAGLAGTAFVEGMTTGYLTYGIGVGIGAACVYVPTLASVGGWFVRRRTTALGIAAAGTGCGMLVMPALTAMLIEWRGWRFANAACGVGLGSLLVLCAAGVRPPPPAPVVAPRSLGWVLRSREFLTLYVSWVLATTALFVPFVLLPAFARDAGAGPIAASALLSVLGGASVAGRLGVGVLADRMGALSLLKIAVLVMAGSHLLWLTSTSYRSLVAFAAVLGVGYGVRIALMPAALIELFGLQNPGAILGAFFTASGIASVLGPILAGLILDRTGDHRWVIAFALAMGAAGFAAIAPLRRTRRAEHG